MVLDIIKNDTFVFKNTREVDKQVRIAMDHTDAPSEFFFVHIKLSPSCQTRSSCASMLQTSCIVFIRQCHEQGLINDEIKENLEEYIMREWVHNKIRKQMSMLESKTSSKDGDDQAANLRGIVSKVRFNFTYNLLILL